VKRVGSRPTLAGAAVAILGASAGLTGCSSPPPGTSAARAAPPAIGVPLDTSFATTTGAVAVVAMGTLGDPLNTFWQLFVRRGATSAWTLATPPGVADNGGLVVSPDADAPDGSPMLAGFEPSQDLVFSPLALSRDGGASWAPGLVPGGLAVVPDALAVSPEAGLLALVRGGGGRILRSAGDPTVWSTVVSRRALAASAAGRRCGVGRLTAVALDAGRGALVGTTCARPGVVGVFATAGGTWRLVGPRLSGAAGSAPTTVLRLVDADGVVSALVAAGHGSTAGLIAVASTTGGAWSRSAVPAMGPGSRVVSTGVESGGGFAVLFSRRHLSLALDVERGPGTGWAAAPSPPPGTSAVAVGTAGGIDALAVASTRLTDWRLGAAAGTWTKIGTVTVPIQFGSSS